jgi:hypothetical protein
MAYIGEQIEELEVVEQPMFPERQEEQPEQGEERRIGFEPSRRQEEKVPAPAGWESV